MHNTFQYDSKQHADLLEMIEKKKVQRAELEDQIQSLSESVASLADKYEKYVRELPVMRKEKSTLLSELATLDTSVKDANTELERLLAQKRPHHDLSVEIQQLKTAVEIERREKDALVTSNGELKREKNDLETQIRIKTTRIAELDEDITEKKQEYNKEIKRFSHAEDTARSLKDRQMALDASIARNQAQIDELALQGTSVGTIVRKIQKHLDDKKIKVDVLKIIQ